MPGSHYSDLSPRNRRVLGEKSPRNQHGSHYTDFSAISRRDIAEKISRPTERHVTSHVTDLDIYEFVIMDADDDRHT